MAAQALFKDQSDNPKVAATLARVVTKSGVELPIGRLNVEVEWPSYSGDVCLFLPVIDRSGSMGGQPFKQVQTALMHMLNQTLAHRFVVLT